MLRLVACAIAIALVSGSASQVRAERFVALVVGNSKYEKADPLPNAQRDAAVIADRLRDLGVDVTEVFDGDAFTLNRAADRFVAQARGADLALFYFAGHGVQLFDQNFLLARDADPSRIARVDDLGLDLGRFMTALRNSGVVRQALLIDACRNNPFAFEETVRLLDLVRKSGKADIAAAPAQGTTRGLARVVLGEQRSAQTRGAETLLFFAAQPGQVSFDGTGQNSSFVEGIKEHMKSGGRPLTEVFREVSSYVRTVTGDEQIPQMVSDWTRDIALGQSAKNYVKYEVASEGDNPLAAADHDFVVRHTKYSGPLRGDFIAIAGTEKTSARPSNPDAKRALEKGFVDGFTITYDLDRDGRDDQLIVSWWQFGYTISLATQGVVGRISNCGHGDARHIEVALRDINGDRRPEIWIFYSDELYSLGTFCILEYRGVPNLPEERRRSGLGETRFGFEVFRTLLLAEGAHSITVANDNTIRFCRNGRCQLSALYTFEDGRFRAVEERLGAPAGSDLPFVDEMQRTANTFAALSKAKGPVLSAAGWQTTALKYEFTAKATVGKRTELSYRCHRNPNELHEYLEIRDIAPPGISEPAEFAVHLGLAYAETAVQAPVLIDGKACGPADVYEGEGGATRISFRNGSACLAALSRAGIVTLPLLHHKDLLRIRLDGVSNPIASVRSACEGKHAPVSVKSNHKRQIEAKAEPGVEPVHPKRIEQVGQTGSIETRVREFFEHYLRQTEGDTEQALVFVGKAFGPEIRYYGKAISREKLIADKRRYFNRWPQRRYKHRPDSARIQCDAGTCLLVGEIDYEVRDPKTSRSARGVAAYEFKVTVSGDVLTVVEESGRTLPRRN